MEPQTYLLFAKKLLEVFNLDKNASIYSLLPSIDSKPDHLKDFYSHILDNQEKLISCGFEIFNGKKAGCYKTSYEYIRIKQEQNKFMSEFALSNKLMGNSSVKLTSDRLSAGLSALSHIYLDLFIKPVQFFIPHSPICSAQWGFFNSIDYIQYRNIIDDADFQRDFRRELLKSHVWSLKLRQGDFSYMVRKTLLRDKKFNTGLDPYCMAKALVVRIGEMGMPAVSYDCVDYPLRDFLAYIGVKRYLRIDMEIQYCKILEKEIAYILSTLIKARMKT